MPTVPRGDGCITAFEPSMSAMKDDALLEGFIQLFKFLIVKFRFLIDWIISDVIISVSERFL